ncbi:hypothetical protein BJP36_28500 [Moorena producens JHB]|uniref:Uncharacterized protein n=1 Tax=Moorena producens (strain JHB) TaxID=1454205 RepID=A0A1D9G7A0_MOOP1|nr:hypothetical protein [Moorena producens]AOY83280.2 hypothetical protein BJP36_28500 [Moorena producens JHB]
MANRHARRVQLANLQPSTLSFRPRDRFQPANLPTLAKSPRDRVQPANLPTYPKGTLKANNLQPSTLAKSPRDRVQPSTCQPSTLNQYKI